jgi:hypothetical protein
MSKLPNVGDCVRVESQGHWWRDGWKIPIKHEFEGVVVPSFPWLGGDYLCITTTEPGLPVRSIKHSSILSITLETGEVRKFEEGAVPAANTYTVQGSKGAVYEVTRGDGHWRCNCVAGGFGRQCKHVAEVKKKLGVD